MSILRQCLKFIAIGEIFAAVEEFLTVIVLRGDVGGFGAALIVVFPIFLNAAFWVSKSIERLTPRVPVRDLALLLFCGLIGLTFEWTLMNLAPWSNPDANPWVMLGFQLGMLSFWTAVGFSPRLFLGKRELNRRHTRRVLFFYIPFFLAVYVTAFAVPAEMQFGAVIGLVCLGHIVVNVFFGFYLASAFADERAQRPLAAA